MSTPPMITLNGRFYSHRPTGMQRYALEMVSRIGDKCAVVRPKRPLKGGLGHIWEQTYLPFATGGRLLWSPNNTGPVTISRQICTMHDLIPIDRPDWFNPKFVALYRWLLPRLTRNLQHMIAISEFTKERLIENFQIDPAKITVIPNGVDKAFQPLNPEQVSAMRKALNLSDKPYVLSVSSLEPRKNLKSLLQAWTKLPGYLQKEYQLVLAGAKGSSAVFGDAGLDHPPEDTVFTGYVPQELLPALYSGAALFAYPSLYEGFGLPPLEAMAAGVPVLTSNNSSIPEVVGDAGILVDPSNIEELASGLLRLMTDESLRRELSGRGIERARGLSWDRTADRTWNVLRQNLAA